MYRRKDDKNIQVTGGNATVCYPSYAKIEEDINISQATIKKYIDILVDINLIRYDNAGIYYPKGNSKHKRESANTYCLYDEYDNWKIEIKESIKFYKSQKEKKGFIFCKDNTYKNNNRKLNGELGALIKLKNKGTATSKQLKRIDEIRSLLSS
jgi:predicted AAA+ superfamily ATPase